MKQVLARLASARADREATVARQGHASRPPPRGPRRACSPPSAPSVRTTRSWDDRCTFRCVIHVLGTDANSKGDLLTRACSDVAHSLGYTALRFNVSKAGREVDLLAQHRVEARLMIAECKATGRPAGGDDLNKFAGVIEAERQSPGAHGLTVEGYFISLGGFTGTALEQESGLRDQRMVLLDAKAVVRELVAGRLVVSDTAAAAAAAGTLGGSAAALAEMVLLLHDIGWIWCVSFATRWRRVAVLIHADGHVLEQSIADVVTAAYQQSGACPSDTIFVAAPDTLPEDAALEVYRRYLESEFGGITLEGLPTDEEVSTRHLRLESLYIPMHVVRLPVGGSVDGELPRGPTRTWNIQEMQHSPGGLIPIGPLLAESRHLAILALPGGGKTTLINRLAVAYGNPERRAAADDDLPDVPWLPVVVRCRHLGELATAPLEKILDDVARRAELGEHRDPFLAAIESRLRDGRVLLLVDGLDELTGLGARATFVNQLRTIVARYPSIHLVVTSREAGFRAVAGSIGALCDQVRLADLSDRDIEMLTVTWHREVVGDRDDVLADATALAARILETDRVRRLARNPLLLTTLLLVKRWVGDLPRKRSVLYGKAIDVLLATWNVEGHEPLDPDEVLPQLAFVAHRMMREGRQSIPATLLAEWLLDARRQMPEVLGYAQISVSNLVARVEERSSLLSMSGHDEADGQLQPIYEFKHLTFQEYLAALALAKGWFDGHETGRTAVDEIAGHMTESEWREVVPLTAVLSGRDAVSIVGLLRDFLRDAGITTFGKQTLGLVFDNLVDCLADEVQITPHVMRDCVEALVRVPVDALGHHLTALLDTRFGPDVVHTAFSVFELGDESVLDVGKQLRKLAIRDLTGRSDAEVVEIIESDLASPDREKRVLALLAAVDILYTRAVDEPYETHIRVEDEKAVQQVARLVARHDGRESVAEHLAWSWALAWAAATFDFDTPTKTRMVHRLADMWTERTRVGVLGMTSLAIVELVPEPGIQLEESRAPALDVLATYQGYHGPYGETVRLATQVLMFYCGASPDLVTSWSDISWTTENLAFARRLGLATLGKVLRISLSRPHDSLIMLLC